MVVARAAPVVAGLLFLCLVWGSTWLAIRVNTRDLPPLAAASIRFLLAAAFIALASRGRRLPVEGRPGWGLWLGLGCIMVAIPYACVYWGEMFIPSGLAAVLFATYPLFVALLAHYGVKGERLTAWLACGVLCSFSGVAVLFSSDLESMERWSAAGGLLILVAALSSAASSVLVKRRLAWMDPLLINLPPMLLGGLLLGAGSLLFERGRTWQLSPGGVTALLYLALFGSAASFAVYYWLMRHIPVSRLAFVTYVTPMVALALGHLIEAEPLTPRLLAGSALVIGGIVLARHDSRLEPESRSTGDD